MSCALPKRGPAGAYPAGEPQSELLCEHVACTGHESSTVGPAVCRQHESALLTKIVWWEFGCFGLHLVCP